MTNETGLEFQDHKYLPKIDGLKDAIQVFEKGLPDLSDYEVVGVYLADCERYEDRCRMILHAAKEYLKISERTEIK